MPSSLEMDDRDSLLVYLVGLSVAVATLFVVVGTMVSAVPFGGFGTRVGGSWIVELAEDLFGFLWIVVLLAYLGCFVVVDRVAASGDRALVAFGLLLLGPACATVLVFGGFALNIDLGYFVVAIVVTGGVPLFGLLVARTAGISEGADGADWSPSRNVSAIIIALVCAGVVVGTVAAVGGTDAIVDTSSGSGPQVAFEFSEDGRTLTVEHAGGASVQADELVIRGSGFTETAAANQTSAGPWQGTTGDAGQVEMGDTLTVGVQDDCEIRLVWIGQEIDRTLREYECSGT